MIQDVSQLLAQEYGIATEPVFGGELAQLTNADAILMRQDPTCIAWTFINLGAAAVFLRPMGVASAAAGVQVAPGGLLSLGWRDDNRLPSLEWHAVSPGGNQNFYLERELIIPGAGGA